MRLTRDGQVVVIHDRALKRLTGAAGRVDDTDAADVRALRLLGTEERVPLLREVLELVDGRVPLLVELTRAQMGWATLPPVVNGANCTKSSSCGGGENLMFWLLDNASTGALTCEQGGVMRANPVVH